MEARACGTVPFRTFLDWQEPCPSNRTGGLARLRVTHFPQRRRRARCRKGKIDVWVGTEVRKHALGVRSAHPYGATEQVPAHHTLSRLGTRK